MSNTLIVDIGNSTLKYAFAGQLSEGATVLPTRSLFTGARLPQAGRVVFSSVVPKATFEMQRRFGSAQVDARELLAQLLPDRTETPAATGTDRLVACYEAHQLTSANCLVVSCGTALVFSLVVDGAFAGGNIVPGPRLMWSALAEGTGQLPPVADDFPPETELLGTSTRSAISRGIWAALRATLSKITADYRECFGSLAVVAHGGWSDQITGSLPADTLVRPQLVLEGLDRLARNA